MRRRLKRAVLIGFSAVALMIVAGMVMVIHLVAPVPDSQVSDVSDVSSDVTLSGSSSEPSAYPIPSGVTASGYEGGETSAEDMDTSGVPGQSCPLEPSGGRETGYRTNNLGRGWTFMTDEKNELVVAGLIDQMRAAGFELVDAETLDLFGDSWGCVATKLEDSEVVLVIVQPEVMGESSGETASSVSIALIDAEAAS